MTVLREFAGRQYGQVTVPQAGFAGVSRNVLRDALDSGAAEWVVPLRVLWIRGDVRARNPRLLAHWLLLDRTPAWTRVAPDCGVVSHCSALALYGLPGFPSAGFEFTVPSASGQAPEGTVLHAGRLTEGEWHEVQGLPVTTPARTLRDFAAAPEFDAEDVGKVASRFLRRQLAGEDELAAALDAHLRGIGATGSGAELLRRLLASAR